MSEINGELQTSQQVGRFTLADLSDVADKRGIDVFALMRNYPGIRGYGKKRIRSQKGHDA